MKSASGETLKHSAVKTSICLVLLLFSTSLPATGDPPNPHYRSSEELIAESPYREAKFSYVSDPHKTILFVSTTGMAGYQNTTALYGSGRLVFRKLYGGKVAEESTVEVDPQMVESVLRQAVDFGLAEWDLTRVQSKQLEKNGGELYDAVPGDAARDVILISLENYERGEYRVPRLERKVHFLGAAFADRLYPSILEIRGVVEIKNKLYKLRSQEQKK